MPPLQKVKQGSLWSVQEVWRRSKLEAQVSLIIISIFIIFALFHSYSIFISSCLPLGLHLDSSSFPSVPSVVSNQIVFIIRHNNRWGQSCRTNVLRIAHLRRTCQIGNPEVSNYRSQFIQMFTTDYLRH